MKIILVLSASKNYRDAVKNGKQYRTYAPTTLTQLAALVPQELNAEIRKNQEILSRFERQRQREPERPPPRQGRDEPHQQPPPSGAREI